jgi:hypothetical protein
MVYKQAWSIKNYRYIGDVSDRAAAARASPQPPREGESPATAAWALPDGSSGGNREGGERGRVAGGGGDPRVA